MGLAFVARLNRERGIALPVRPRFTAMRVGACCCLLAGDGEQLPVAGHALELMDAMVSGLDTGLGDEICHGALHEDVTAMCDRGDTGTDVDRDPANTSASQFDFAGVESNTDVDAERSQAAA